ncbi:MAG: hypothetical protein ACHQHP_00875 [Bacteroidia bacterium]
MRNLLSILFFFFSFAVLFAQDVSKGISPAGSQNNNDDVPFLYRNEQEFGGVAHSSGWGFNYRRCKHITGYKKRVLEFEIVGMKSPKEIKVQPPSDIGIKPYFYGKQFTVTFLRVGWGYNKVLTGKSERKGVELRLVTLAGPVMAFAKPVYLNVWYPDSTNAYSGNIVTERYNPKNPWQTEDNIAGRASYFTGFGQMQFFPGAFCKLGLSFEHGKNDDDVQLLETGITVDAFYKTIPIMANTRNNQVFVNVYLNIMFGKKWF